MKANEVAEEMLQKDHVLDINDAEAPTNTPSPTYWQSHKHILKPLAIFGGTAVAAAATGLIVYLSKHSSPSESPSSFDSLSAGWTDNSTVSFNSLSQGGDSSSSNQMLEQFGSYLYTAANMVPSLIALLSSSNNNPASSNALVCSSKMLDLQDTLNVAMQQGGEAIIQDNSNPVTCLLSWTNGRLEGILCQSLPLAESVFSAFPNINGVACSLSTSTLSSDPGFVQISFYGDKRNVLYTTKGLPASDSPSETPSTQSLAPSTQEPVTTQSPESTSTTSMPTHTPSTSTPTTVAPTPTPVPNKGYPVGNCTFYNEYVSANLLVKQLLQNVVCNTTIFGNVTKLNFNSTVLFFQNINIGDNGAIALAPALQQLTSLMYFNLYNTSIGDNGAIALAPALQQMSQLNQFKFLINKIGDNGAIALAHALQNKTLMKYLDLSNNNIGNDGAIALASALGNMTELRYLDLSNNNIGYSGAEALIQSLGLLLHLDDGVYLLHNNITDAQCVGLYSAIHHNTSYDISC